MSLTIEQPVASTNVGSQVRVLMIDDDEDFCQVVSELLTEHGYSMKCVANPVKALELYTRDKFKFDLVMLDYYMPGLDGGKTCDWLRKLNPDVKVILCSGAEELRLRCLTKEHALDGYMRKPFRVEEALFIINQVLGN